MYTSSYVVIHQAGTLWIYLFTVMYMIYNNQPIFFREKEMENFVSVIWAYRSNLKLLNCHQQWVVNLDCQPKMSMAQGKIHFNANILFSHFT